MSSSNVSDSFYGVDQQEWQELYRKRPWFEDPRYFQNVHVSVTASLKVLRHSLKGVSDGRSRNGTPVEVMGLLLGRVVPHGQIVTDAIPQPVEGIEYQVSAQDDALAVAALLSDLVEERREDRFLGWYHSHPFDVGTHSHCHQSSIDCSTQGTWQFSSPWWIAMVCDPLRSIAQQRPEQGVYRTYPPEFTPTTLPNGQPLNTPQAANRWGVAMQRYYELDVTYFTSDIGASLFHHKTKQARQQAALERTPYSTAFDLTTGMNELQRVTTKLRENKYRTYTSIFSLQQLNKIASILTGMYSVSLQDVRIAALNHQYLAAVVVYVVHGKYMPSLDRIQRIPETSSVDLIDLFTSIPDLFKMAKLYMETTPNAKMTVKALFGYPIDHMHTSTPLAGKVAEILHKSDTNIPKSMAATLQPVADVLHSYQCTYNCCANTTLGKQIIFQIVKGETLRDMEVAQTIINK